MEIRLEMAIEADALSILEMQVRAFLPLLKKYKDEDTSPANETLEKVLDRITNPDGHYYKILQDEVFVDVVYDELLNNMGVLSVAPLLVDVTTISKKQAH